MQLYQCVAVFNSITSAELVLAVAVELAQLGQVAAVAAELAGQTEFVA